jgi:hypothetical protein
MGTQYYALNTVHHSPPGGTMEELDRSQGAWGRSCIGLGGVYTSRGEGRGANADHFWAVPKNAEKAQTHQPADP